MRTTIRPLRLFLSVLLAIAGLSLVSHHTAWAAEDDEDRGLAQRLDRLEQEVHQLADRQPPGNQRPGPMMNCPQGPMRGECQMGPQCMMPGDGRMEACRSGRRYYPACCILGTILIVLAIVHILLAVWVYKDIRKRGEGSGIFIVLALLIGIPGAALYLLARIGDRKP